MEIGKRPKRKKNDKQEELLQRISELTTDISYWKKQHDRARKREEKLKNELKDKKARIRYLESQLYNKKSEKSKSKSEATDKKPPVRRKKGNQKGTPPPPRRNYDDLDTETEVCDIPDEEKICSCCGKPLVEMGTDDSEILEINVKGYRRIINRKKYAKRCTCDGSKKGIITAPGPGKLFSGGIIGISIWVCILIRKYQFQIPVARVLKNLKLNGLDLAKGTVGDGLKRLAPMFEPVYAALEERSRMADWWQADETRWSVFEQTKSKTSYRWYLWVFISSESVVHIIDPTRSARVIEDHLGKVIEGILLVDRYSAYKSFAKKRNGILLAFCWSHARRDVIDAGKKYPTLEDWANEWQDKINGLFHQNNLRMQYPPGSKQFKKEDDLLRKSLAGFEEDFIEELKTPRLHHEQKKVLGSLQNHWSGLTVFLDHPHIPMDNNGSERTLRNSALGRKNYYGSQTIWSGQFTATMLSIFETLQLWKINGQQWLTDYLNACADRGGMAPEDITSFLPWHIKKGEEPTRTYCGRGFSKFDIQCIKEIINADTSRNRADIARKSCEYLQWYKPDGSTKEVSMRIALSKMEKDGHFVLPPSQSKHPERIRKKVIKHTDQTAPGEELFVPAGALPELRISIAGKGKERELWNEYVDRYHYLGYTTIPGASLKYFVYAGDELLALLGFGASAWRVAPRDDFIGWSEEKRIKNLNLIIGNARFLILPWVFSKNLASKILSLVARRVAEDWEVHYKYRPVLIETFVEQKRFEGTCYKAANWQYLGLTQGRGKKDRQNKFSLPKKKIFIYPLDKKFRKVLC